MLPKQGLKSLRRWVSMLKNPLWAHASNFQMQSQSFTEFLRICGTHRGGLLVQSLFMATKFKDEAAKIERHCFVGLVYAHEL